jgi:hypothetical protein
LLDHKIPGRHRLPAAPEDFTIVDTANNSKGPGADKVLVNDTGNNKTSSDDKPVSSDKTNGPVEEEQDSSNKKAEDREKPEDKKVDTECSEKRGNDTREAYKKELEQLLEQNSKSSKVLAGEGYYQVLKRMHPEMKPAELNNLALEVRSANGNNHVLHRGGQFDLLSAEQKNVLLNNMMNTYDRAHGAKDLKDANIDPRCAKLAAEIKAKVEKLAEPDLKKSLELKKSEPEQKQEKPKEDKKPEDKQPEQKPDIPMELQVQKAEEACANSYDAVDKHANLATYVAKHFDPDTETYKSTMKGLADQMAEEQRARTQLESLHEATNTYTQ